MDKYLPQFVNSLPLKRDLEQAGLAHELLMSFVKAGHPVFQAQAGKICRIFLEVYEREWSTNTLNTDICKLFKELTPERMRQMQPPLTEKQKNRIKKIIRDAKNS